MRAAIGFPTNPARPLLLLLCGGLCLLIILAPALAASKGSAPEAAFIYLFFAPICHQHPERSFFFLGHTLAVCHRCTGIYFGLFLGLMSPRAISRLVSSPLVRRVWVIAAAAPMMLDVVLPYLGIWTNGAYSRVATGGLFGVMVSPLLLEGIAELFEREPTSPSHFPAPLSKGGIS